jgi:hypothetical protein
MGGEVTRDPEEAAGAAVHWDDAQMKTSYANVCNVASTGEEIVLLFGVNQAWRTGQREIAVQLSDRLILSPFAAKRLAGLLGDALREYERGFGPLPPGTEAAPGTRAQPNVTIKWDDTGLRSTYANMCSVASTREEVVLLFGINQAWHAGQREVRVQLSDRIVLSPFAARRLSVLLDGVVRKHESRFGPLPDFRP